MTLKAPDKGDLRIVLRQLVAGKPLRSSLAPRRTARPWATCSRSKRCRTTAPDRSCANMIRPFGAASPRPSVSPSPRSGPWLPNYHQLLPHWKSYPELDLEFSTPSAMIDRRRHFQGAGLLCG